MGHNYIKLLGNCFRPGFNIPFKSWKTDYHNDPKVAHFEPGLSLFSFPPPSWWRQEGSTNVCREAQACVFNLQGLGTLKFIYISLGALLLDDYFPWISICLFAHFQF